MALRRRIKFTRGSRVLVMGATGSAGRIAIQVAKLFGASEVIGAGRNPARLSETDSIGADRVLGLDDLAQASEVDVVLDYLWGEPAARGMLDLLTNRADRGRPLTWIQVGSAAGATSPIPSAVLRSARLQLVGSGVGSVSGRELARELPGIAQAASRGTLRISARQVPPCRRRASLVPGRPGESTNGAHPLVHVALFGSDARTYATLAGVVGRLRWLWITSYAILLGAGNEPERLGVERRET